MLEGRYRVDAKIATGGMSTVYRGLDVRLDRPVALKVMDARYASDSQFLTRFQREARAVARLKDPGLVAVYDQGLDGRHPFLVMELVEGGTLRELLRERGPMPPHAVAAVLRPVLGGLATAHHAGLVHRDVKPENVLISDDGEVKIADFGLVRAVAEAKITSTSVILGTAAYLSPEQVSTGDGRPAQRRLRRRHPGLRTDHRHNTVHRRHPLAVAYQRMDHDVPPPSAVISGVPRQFDEFVRARHRPQSGERFADAAEMAEDLDAIVDELASRTSGCPRRSNSAQHAVARTRRPRRHRPRRTAPSRQPQPSGHPRRARPAELVRDPTMAADDGRGRSPSAQADSPASSSTSSTGRASAPGGCCCSGSIAVLTLAGLAAAGAWTLGSNLSNLL